MHKRVNGVETARVLPLAGSRLSKAIPLAGLEVSLYEEVGPIIYIPRAAGVEGVITPLVEGIPVALINLVTQERLTTATDPQGYYHFGQPQPGTYALRVENLLPDRGLRLKAPPPGSFSAGPGQFTERNFEYVEVGGQIHGYVFLSFDGTAIRSVANPPIPDVYVELSGESGKTIELQKTGTNGEYFFTNVPQASICWNFAASSPIRWAGSTRTSSWNLTSRRTCRPRRRSARRRRIRLSTVPAEGQRQEICRVL